MKGKLLTIAGIVLIFGYFITESIKNDTSDPTKIVIVGTDTLGRDWGAIADQKEAEARALNSISSEDPYSASSNDQIKNGGSLIDPTQDPYSRDKFNSSNYSTIQDASGREVVVGYDRPEEQQNQDPYSSRHQREKGEIEADEPQMQYRY